MKIDVYVMMRNEIKLIHYFLRHYETFADRIFVWDDESDDGTKEVLLAHSRVTLLPLSLRGIDDDYARQHLFFQYREISRGNADWVMQVDSDEFVYHPRMKERLGEIKEEGFELVMPVGFLMVNEGYPTTSGQIYDEIKMGLRDPLMDKPVIFQPSIELMFGGGRHRTDILRKTPWREGEPRNDNSVRRKWKSGLKYLHYRYFGMDDFIERIRRNCERMALSGSDYSKLCWPFSEDKTWRMPDKSKTAPRKWFTENLQKRLIKVIE